MEAERLERLDDARSDERLHMRALHEPFHGAWIAVSGDCDLAGLVFWDAGHCGLPSCTGAP